MPAKESRFELKPLLAFLKTEFREKRPNGIDLLLVKQRAIFTRGVLPELQIRAYPGSRHLVIEDLGSDSRIYYFNLDGSLAGGVTVPSNSASLAKIWKGSRSLFHLPKEIPAPRPEDVAEGEYQKFVKIYADVAALWGAKRNPPPLPIVPAASYIMHGPDFGLVEAVEKENGKNRRLALAAVQSASGRFLLTREAFQWLMKNEELIITGPIVTDISVLLASAYLGASGEPSLALAWQETSFATSDGTLDRIIADNKEILLHQFPEMSQATMRAFIQAVGSSIKFLRGIGEVLSYPAALIFFATISGTFSVGNNIDSGTILSSFYLELGKFPATSNSANLAKVLLLNYIFGEEEGGITSEVLALADQNEFIGILDAVTALGNHKYQPLVDILKNYEESLDPPLRVLACRAIAARLRGGDIHIELPKISILRVENPFPFEVLVSNLTDIPLLNAEMTMGVQPSHRVVISNLEREGPADLHYKLKFKGNVLGKKRGKISLEVRLSFDHPCPGEKKVVTISKQSLQVE